MAMVRHQKANYDHVQGHLRTMNERRPNRYILQAQANQALQQLSALVPMLGHDEVQQLQQRFPGIALGELAGPPPTKKVPPPAALGSPRLPTIESPRHTQQKLEGAVNKSGRARRKGQRAVRVLGHGRGYRARGDAPEPYLYTDVRQLLMPIETTWLAPDEDPDGESSGAGGPGSPGSRGGVKFVRMQTPLDELDEHPPPSTALDVLEEHPLPSSGMPSANGIVGGVGDGQPPQTLWESRQPPQTLWESNRPGPVGIQSQTLWESNPASLAPPRLLRQQPVTTLLERRHQSLDGLIGLLHSLARVRHAASRLPHSVATAYQERLQHAIGWYRVTTCELVERIDYGRRQGEYGKPTLKRIPTGEWRQVYPPIILDRVNVLLSIGRGDLTFAPLPAAADPLLLLWFSTQVNEWCNPAEGGVQPDLLAPQCMHSLLELARMQSAHELLLHEAELYGLAPLPESPYSARENELGLIFEMLLYGAPGRYVELARRMRAATLLLAARTSASRCIGRMLRGWIARAQIRAYKAAMVVQAIYRRWKKVSVMRARRRREHDELASKPLPASPKSPHSSKGARAGARWGRASRILAKNGELQQKKWMAKVQSIIDPKSPEEGAGAGDTLSTALSVHLDRSTAPAAARAGAIGYVNEEHSQEHSQEPMDEEEQRIADAAARIQARMRGLNAQREVVRLAQAAEKLIEGLRNPICAEKADVVCRAYRAKAAFSTLLLKAFKQRMMGILMHSAETDLIKGGGCPPSVWRMAVEGVRSRCVLALSPIESDYEVKSKHHREYEALQIEHERLTGRLQFWEGLREGSLPEHFCCLRTLDASGAIARAKEHHESLVAQRALALPEGMAPSMFVWRLAGLVRALVELQVAVAGSGSELHELEAYERQLRSHLAHMGCPDPAHMEAEPPMTSDPDRIHMQTKSSQFRASSIAAASARTRGGAAAAEGLGETDVSAAQRERAKAARARLQAAKQSSPTMAAGAVAGSLDPEGSTPTAPHAEELGHPRERRVSKQGEPSAAPGVALEETIAAAKSEIVKLEAVRELLLELI